jgi:gliding motility-associated-like protein
MFIEVYCNMFFVKNNRLLRYTIPMKWGRAFFIILIVFSYSSAQAQPCTIPIINNSIDIRNATCINTVATLQGTTPFGGNGTYSFQWERSIGNCGNGNFSPIPLATARDYPVPAGTSPNDCFRRIVVSGICTSTSNSTRVALNEQTTPPAPVTVSVNSSCASASGSITITSPAPAAGITYSINGTTYTNTTGIFTNLSPGTYLVSAQFPTGCKSPEKTVVISANPPISGTITPASATFCAGGNQVLTVSGGNSYQWYRNDTLIIGATGANYTATVAGTYTADIIVGICKVKASNNSVITVTPLPTGPISPASGIICAGSSIQLSTSGGTSYQWSRNGTPIPGSTGPTFTVTLSGTYTVMISFGGCSNAASNAAVITVGVPPSGFITPASAFLCSGGQVLLTVTTAGGVNSYQWFRNGTQITGATLATYNATQTGNYNVNIQSGTCSGLSSNIVTIADPNPITFTATPVNPNCTSTTGNINISGVSGGGSGNYLYSKDNGVSFQTASTFNSLTAGTYQVVVKDTAGCISFPRPVTIQSFISTLSGTANTTSARCGEASGAVTIQASGGSMPYTYKLGNGNYQSSNSFTNLSAGNYRVTVKDQPGCLFDVNFIIAQSGNPPNLIITNPPDLCPGFTANLKALPVTAGSDAGLTYTYWRDTTAATVLQTPEAVLSGTYYIKANNTSACFTIKRVVVKSQTQGCILESTVFVPTGFTPNRNGANDVLRPVFYNVAELLYFKIYNRWGQEVFKTNVIGQGWDGTIKGVRQPSETYSWILGCVGKNGDIIKESGRTLLIR